MNSNQTEFDVVNICYDDYANFMLDHHRSLKTVGINSFVCKLIDHPFYDRNQAPKVTEKEMVEYCKRAKVIQIFHSDDRLLGWVKNLGKPIILYHTGSKYRTHHKRLNASFNVPYVYMNVTDQTDLWHLGLQRKMYIMGAVDTDKLKPNELLDGPKNKPYLFAHYPSNKIVKGTDRIEKAFRQTYINYDLDTTILPHEQSLNRMRLCDVYVELFKPQLNGELYGCMGVTAMEAAALGKVVITQNLRNEIYVQHYGENQLQLFSTAKELRSLLRRFNDMGYVDLYQLKFRTHDWVRTKHSLQATGEYIKKNILNGLI